MTPSARLQAVVLTQLPSIVPMKPDRPEVGGPDHPMRRVTRDVAFDPQGWTTERAAEVAALFDTLAPTWSGRDGPERHDSLLDALARGGPFPDGPCLEVGSGTGNATPFLRERFRTVVSADLSREMLALADPSSPRVRADSCTLPIRDRTVGAVALVNMFLFPIEIDRVLAPGGALLFVSTLGEVTPIYLPASDVLAALPGTWDGTAAAAGWGSWLVARRAG